MSGISGTNWTQAAAVRFAIANTLVSNVGSLSGLLQHSKLPSALGVLAGPQVNVVLGVSITVNQAANVARVGPRLVQQQQQGLLGAYFNVRGIACDNALIAQAPGPLVKPSPPPSPTPPTPPSPPSAPANGSGVGTSAASRSRRLPAASQWMLAVGAATLVGLVLPGGGVAGVGLHGTYGAGGARIVWPPPLADGPVRSGCSGGDGGGGGGGVLRRRDVRTQGLHGWR